MVLAIKKQHEDMEGNPHAAEGSIQCFGSDLSLWSKILLFKKKNSRQDLSEEHVKNAWLLFIADHIFALVSFS